LEKVNRKIEESVADLKELIKNFPELNVRLDIATAFGCPFLGKVPEEKVYELIEIALNIGVKEIVLCDTIGIAYPTQVENLVRSIFCKFPGIPLALHLHDTRGMGLANALAGLNAGISALEASVGGLGGCPFAPGAAGNTATEDMLNMLHSMGVETGIDYNKYVDALIYVKNNIQNTLIGHMVNACKYRDE